MTVRRKKHRIHRKKDTIVRTKIRLGIIPQGEMVQIQENVHGKTIRFGPWKEKQDVPDRYKVTYRGEPLWISEDMVEDI